MMLALLGILFCGCDTVHNAYRVDSDDLADEGSVVFTRAAKFYPFFGSYSISEFVEITYDQVSVNDAGMLVAEVGIRNRGPVRWTNWWKGAPEQIVLKARCVFFRGDRGSSPAVYSTNEQEIVIDRGQTYLYKAVCPVEDASSYQLVLGGVNR